MCRLLLCFSQSHRNCSFLNLKYNLVVNVFNSTFVYKSAYIVVLFLQDRIYQCGILHALTPFLREFLLMPHNQLLRNI